MIVKPEAKRAGAWVPMYRQSGRGKVYASTQINRRTFSLGKYGSPESLERFHRLVSEYVASGYSRVFGLPTYKMTVGELIDAYLVRAEAHYGGTQGEFAIVKYATDPMRAIYASVPAVEFGPLQLRAVRQKYIQGPRGLRSRGYVNKLVRHVVRMFEWAVSEALLDVAVVQKLVTLPKIRKGQTDARESKRICPVAPEVVEATLTFLPRVLRAMVEFQQLTGCRPGELVILRPCDVDREGEVWEYRPFKHKTEHHDKDRVIYIGPKAQSVLKPYLQGPAEQFCFSPREATMQARKMTAYRNGPRLCPRYPSERRRVRLAKGATAKRYQRRLHLDRYKTGSYRKAIQRACVLAFGDSGARWSPHQLRHNAATEARRVFGLEAAQIMLGHSNADVTQIYAERDKALATRVAKEIG